MANNIDPEKEIEKMLQKEAEATTEQEKRAQQYQQKVEEFLRQYDEAVESVIIPALKSVGEAAKKAGITFSIEHVSADDTRTLEPGGKVLKLMRKGSSMPTRMHKEAALFVMADLRLKCIDFYRNTEGYTARPMNFAARMKMEDLTEDKVKENALIVVEALIQNP